MTASMIEQEKVLVSRPLRHISQSWLFLLLFTVALVVQLVGVRRALGLYDESLALYGADRILHGGRPYRDFLTLYGPAQFYVLALVFKLFGVSALVGRVYDAFVKAGIACASFALVARLASRKYAMLAFAAVVLWLTCIDHAVYNYSAYPALLFSLISCLFFSRYLKDPSKLWPLFVAGVLVGVTACFRHDFGFYLCITQLITLVWSILSSRAPGVTARSSLPALRRPSLCYISGIVMIVVPVALLLLWAIPYNDIFFDLFYLPAKIYPKMRSLPFRTFAIPQLLLHPFSWSNRYELEEAIVYFPILACLASAVVLFLSRKPQSGLFSDTRQRQIFGLLTILGTLFFVKGLIRLSATQMMQCIIVGIILLAILLSRIPQLGRASSIMVAGCALIFLACSVPIVVSFFVFTHTNVVDLTHPNRPTSVYNTCHPPVGIERARCLILDPVDTAAIQYVEQRTSPQDRIFVGAGRHDKILVNDIRFYFVSDRAAITKWQEFDPGVQTTLPFQNQIIASMQEYSPKFIVLNSTWDNYMEPNGSRFSSGVTALDDYIHTHYIPQATFDKVVIMGPNSSFKPQVQPQSRGTSATPHPHSQSFA
jgi:Dolichyl-phosphate-mannose-protein mannosyltransferase